VNLSLADKLQWVTDSITLLLPELVLAAGIVVLLITTLARVKSKASWISITVFSLLCSAFLVVSHWPAEPTPLLLNMLRTDDFSAAFKLLFLAGALLTMVMFASAESEYLMEWCVMLLSLTLGAHLLAMSTHAVMVLLSLELVSISSYVLVGFRFNKQAAEASLKYFLFGSIATAVMIYGFSLLFTLSGTLYFSSASFFDRLLPHAASPLFITAGIFVLSGFLFKTSAVPFHLWTPDVYQAAPLPVVAFLSVVPKLAGVAVLLKFSLALQLFGQSTFPWHVVLATVSLLTIIVGNVSALLQKNVMRMMAYSSIAQAGFLIAALSPMSAEATQFLLLYSAVFLLANFTVFFSLQYFENSTGAWEITHFSGWGFTTTTWSLSILIGLVALTGLPPTAGFTAKLFVFTSIWQEYLQNHHVIFLWLFIAGLLNTVISLFFYLKIPFYLFMRQPLTTWVAPKKSWSRDFFTAVVVIALVLLFFYPSLLMSLVNRVTFVL